MQLHLSIDTKEDGHDEIRKAMAALSAFNVALLEGFPELGADEPKTADAVPGSEVDTPDEDADRFAAEDQ
jgi:hypothetical protein